MINVEIKVKYMAQQGFKCTVGLPALGMRGGGTA